MLIDEDMFLAKVTMERGVGIFIKAAVGDEESSVFSSEGTFYACCSDHRAKARFSWKIQG